MPDPKRRKGHGDQGHVGPRGEVRFGSKQKEANDLIRDLQTRVSLLREEVEGRKRKERGWEREELWGSMGVSRSQFQRGVWKSEQDVLEDFRPDVRRKVARRLHRICSAEAEQEREKWVSKEGKWERKSKEEVVLTRVANCMGVPLTQVEEWVQGDSSSSGSSSSDSGSSSSDVEGSFTSFGAF